MAQKPKGERTLEEVLNPAVEKLAASEEKLRGVERQLKDQKKLVESWIAKFEESEQRLAVALALKHDPHRRTLRVDARNARERKVESTAFMVGSDWHVEETVDPATVNGRNV